MSPAVAIAVAAVLTITGILGCYILWPSHPRHARAAAAFTAPAAATGPDGAQFLAELHREDPPGGYDNSPAATARLLGALRGWAARRADDTQPIPHAVGTWGKTVSQLLDEMQAEYLEVKR